MALGVRSTTRLVFSRLVSVSVYFFAFAVLPLPQFVVLTCAEAAEGQCPREGEGENSEEELVFWSSARRRLNHRHRSDLRQSCETGHRLHRKASSAGHLPAIVGHQLAHGLGAPLLV